CRGKPLDIWTPLGNPPTSVVIGQRAPRTTRSPPRVNSSASISRRCSSPIRKVSSTSSRPWQNPLIAQPLPCDVAIEQRSRRVEVATPKGAEIDHRGLEVLLADASHSSSLRPHIVTVD